jgi:hypothetical protein
MGGVETSTEEISDVTSVSFLPSSKIYEDALFLKA